MFDRNTAREANVDLMKGFCILFVMLFHCGPFGLPELVVRTISSFYLPVFFFCSGLFFTNRRGFVDFTVNKTNMLIVPFVFFLLLAFPFVVFFAETPPTDTHGWVRIAYHSVLFPFDRPIWFLPAIFWTFLIYWLITKASGRFWVRFALVAAVWALGAVAVELCDGRSGVPVEVFLYLHISSGMLTVPFMFAGHELRMRGLLGWRPSALAATAIVLVGMAVCVCVNFRGEISYYANLFTPGYLLHLLGAFGGIAMLWVVCLKVKRLPVVSLMGEYSLVILCTHYFGIHVAKELGCENQFLLLAVAVVCSVAGLVLIPRYLPRVIGRKPFFKMPAAKRDGKARREE